MDQSDIDLHEEEEARERAALAKAWLGLLGPGDDAPNDALILRERSPAFGDDAEIHAHRDLGGRAGIVRNESRVAILAVPIFLPDPATALTRHRDFKNSHNRYGLNLARSAGDVNEFR
jgi:hypothetical protein